MPLPNIVATLMQELRTNGVATLGGNENRPSEYGALDLFRKQSTGPRSILTTDLQNKLSTSFGQVVKASVIDYENPTISNVRTCAVQTGGATSKQVPFTFFTVSFGFVMVPAMFGNNDLRYEDLWTNQLASRINKTRELLDTKCIDFANLNKNSYFPASMLSYYAQSGNAFQVPLQTDSNGEKNWRGLYNYLTSILSQQDFGGATPDILTNPRGMADVRSLKSQGQYNGVNRAWEVDLVGNFFQSPRVLNSTPDVAATEYAVLPGSVAITGRLDPDCLKPNNYIGSAESPVKLWDKAVLPGIGDEFGLFYQADCGDQSAALTANRLSGLTRTRVESYEWSRDYCIFGAYNSDPTTRYQPIDKFELLAQ
jgi:hypothetical protein